MANLRQFFPNGFDVALHPRHAIEHEAQGMNASPVDVALALAQHGIPVFPCAQDKRPRVKWREAATTDHDQICGWWKQWPDAMPAIPTGEASGVFVIDLDVDKQTGEPIGEETAIMLGIAHDLLSGSCVQTPSAGQHFYFQHPGEGFGNTASRLGPCIDTRGDGGFIIAPGSVNGAGCYSPCTPIDWRSLPELPASIRVLLAKPEPRQQQQRDTAAPGAWADAALRDELSRVLAAHEGTRNKTLNLAALRLGQIIAGGALTEDAVRSRLLGAALSIGLSEDEARATIDSGLQAGMRNPRGPKAPDDTGEAGAAKSDARHGNASRRLQVLSVEELCARTRPAWLVRGLLLRTGTAVMYGASGAGKTFATLDMACAIVRGAVWMGRRTKRGRVVYIASEGSLMLRLGAYIEHHDISAADLNGLAVVEQSVDLLSPDGDLEELLAAITDAMQARNWDDVSMVVIDTLNRAMPGGNENAPEDMGRMVEAAKRIEEQLSCLVMYIHHAGKDESKGSRGHSSLKAATDAEISVKGNGDGPRFLHAEKIREGESGVDVGAFTLERIDLGATSDHDADADPDERDWSCVVAPCEMPERQTGQRLSDKERLAMSYLHRTLDVAQEAIPAEVRRAAGKARPKDGQNGCRVDAWRDTAVSAAGLSPSDNPATHRQAFHRCRERLESTRNIEVCDGWVWLRDKRDIPRQL